MSKSLCGARIWIDWTTRTPLLDRLYEYEGTTIVNGEVMYTFLAYRRRGYPVLMTFQQLNMRLHYFKPFIIDSAEFVENLHA